MSREHISHSHIVGFADRVVNLSREDAQKHRNQVNGLREKLEGSVRKHPDFVLKKTLLSGSLAKYTALRSINDADVAVYVKSATEDVGKLTQWLAGELQHAYPNFSPDQVTVQSYSVRVDFRGTGLNVDVVPVYAVEGKEEGDWGDLVSQEDGSKLRTNITLHKEFIRMWPRMKEHEQREQRNKNRHYRQVVRLVKWWVRTRKKENSQFGFKSFMVESILAKLVGGHDQKVPDGCRVPLDDYPEALLAFFDYIAKTGLSEQIHFTVFPDAGTPGPCSDPIRVFDPVNAENNVGRKYGEGQRRLIVDECVDAGDAIEAALHAPTKTETLAYWRKVFGSPFSD